MSVATTAYISKNGLVFVFFTSGIPPVFTTVTAVSSSPSFYLNGSGSPVSNVQGPFWTNGAPASNGSGQTAFWVAYQMPTTPAATDVLTFSASASWATTAAGAAPAATTQAVTNYVGQLEPAFGYLSNWGPNSNQTVQVPGFNDASRTLQLGMNVGWNAEGLPYSVYSFAQNWLKRSAWSNIATEDSRYHPLTISAASATTPVDVTGFDTQIDSRGLPIPTGVWTFIADETAPGMPMSVAITLSAAAASAVTTAYSGNLSGGVEYGKRWTIPVAYSADPPTNFNIQITVTVSGYGGSYPATWTLRNESLVAPVATTGLAPAVISNENDLAPDQNVLNWLTTPNGRGPACVRWVDGVLTFDGISNVVDPTDLRNATDFTWRNSQQSPPATTVSELRYYDITASPRVYVSQPYPGTTPSPGSSLFPTTPAAAPSRPAPGRVTWRGGLGSSGHILPGGPTTVRTAPGVGRSGSVRWRGSAGGDPAAYYFSPANNYYFNFGGSSPSGWFVAEAVCAGAHGLKTGQTVTLGGTGNFNVTNGPPDAVLFPTTPTWVPSRSAPGGVTWRGGLGSSGHILPGGPTTVRTAPGVGRSGSVRWRGATGTPTVKTNANNGVSIAVTGANTFVFLYYANGITKAYPAPTYINQISPQIPALGMSATIADYVPDQGAVPYEFAAYATGQLPGSDIWVNIPIAASDATVQAIARKIRDNFPPGRRVWIEYSNEVWSDISSQYIAYALGTLIGTEYGSALNRRQFYCLRAAQHKATFVSIFSEPDVNGNTNRMGEVKLVIGAQFGGGTNMEGLVTAANQVNTIVQTYNAGSPSTPLPYCTADAFAIAPYFDTPSDSTLAAACSSIYASALAPTGEFGTGTVLCSGTSQASYPWTRAQWIDVLRHWLMYSNFYMNNSNGNGFQAAISSVATYKSVTPAQPAGFVPAIVGYEAAFESLAPIITSQNDPPAGPGYLQHVATHDVYYDPAFYDLETTVHQAIQFGGLKFANKYSLCVGRQTGAVDDHVNMYGHATWAGQQPGHGDGRGGSPTNRTYDLVDGLAQDAANVSPRLQAWLDWAAAANPGGSGPPTRTGSSRRYFPRLNRLYRGYR